MCLYIERDVCVCVRERDNVAKHMGHGMHR